MTSSAALFPLLAFGVLALALAGVLIRRPVAVVVTLAVLLPFNDLISMAVVSPTLRTGFGAVKDLLLGLLLLSLAKRSVLRQAPSGLAVALGMVLLLAFGAGLRTDNMAQALYGFRNDLEPLLLLLLVPAALRLRAGAAARVSSVMVWAGQAAALLAVATWSRGVPWLYQVGVLPATEGSFPFQYFVSGGTEPRAFSPYIAPNELGAASAITIAVALFHPRWRAKTRVALSLLPAAAIVASQSRSALLGLVLVVLFRAGDSARGRSWAGRSLVYATAFACAATSLPAILSSARLRDASALGHLDSIRETTAWLLQHPLGTGLGTVGPRAMRFGSDVTLTESFLLLLALEAGVLLLCVYLYVIWRIVRTASDGGREARLAIAALLATAVSQLTLPILQDGAVSYWLWIAVGVGLAQVPPSTLTQEHVARPRLSR